jgi:YVTN family beta-propeller protein
VLALVALGFAVTLTGAAAGGLTPGPQGDGTAVTPQGWLVTPAGTQTPLGPGPLAAALSPTGSVLLVANGGYWQQSLMVVDPVTGSIVQTLDERGANAHGPWSYANGHQHSYYAGLAFSPDGSTVWASDGAGGALHSFAVSGKTLTATHSIQLGSANPYPAGIAVAPDGSRVYVAGNFADTLLFVDPTTRKVVATVPVGHLPYGVVLNHDGSLAFVANSGASSVSVVDTATARVVRTVTVGTHPTALALSPTRDEVYVANADSDAISVLDAGSGALLRTIDLRPYAGASVGTTPNAVTASPDGETLYVAEAGNNAVAVVGLAPEGSSGGDSIVGYIPTAWYPDAVTLDPQGQTLFVTSMKGVGVGPNLALPTSTVGEEGAYWPMLLRGALARIPVPDSAQLASYTAQVRANDHFDARPSVPAGGVLPATPGAPTPIEHVIYVMKENRSYDQLLGDLGKGNGDPALAIFGEQVTPNTHALARRFVTFDNFYADAEVSADGWSWTTGAYANDYIQKNWPLDYNGYGRPYDFGGFGNAETAGLPGRDPGRDFLWDDLAAHGVDYENFGFFVDNPVDLQGSIPGLLDHTDPLYPGWDLLTTDQTRMDRWLSVFSGYVKQGRMPTMQFVYLPSDHTYATTPSARKPSAYVADNDLALGRLVQAVSHSPFWSSTAIFVVEDDAQDGPDHVDAHRSLALVISPYTQTGAVDSTLYSSVSVLRTIETILGVPPMSEFDAAAQTMANAFTTSPSFTPYDAILPGVSLKATNDASSPMASTSEKIDFSRPDEIPMRLMNEILWKSVHGARSRLPVLGSGG